MAGKTRPETLEETCRQSQGQAAKAAVPLSPLVAALGSRGLSVFPPRCPLMHQLQSALCSWGR